ncbi:hypothetical protein DFH11DRAFT_1734486, partial [Phellopilus nigrolimitatus]
MSMASKHLDSDDDDVQQLSETPTTASLTSSMLSTDRSVSAVSVSSLGSPPSTTSADTTVPPRTMEGAYAQERALEDIPGIKHALNLFLASHM